MVSEIEYVDRCTMCGHVWNKDARISFQPVFLMRFVNLFAISIWHRFSMSDIVSRVNMCLVRARLMDKSGSIGFVSGISYNIHDFICENCGRV